MIELLGFLAKIIGTFAAASFFLFARSVAILRWMNVEPAASLDKSTFADIVFAGIFGFCALAVALIAVVGKSFLRVGMPVLIERAQDRKTALKNLEAPRPEFVAALRYLKAHNVKRFRGPPVGKILPCARWNAHA